MSALSVEMGMARGLFRSSSEMMSASVTSVLSSFVALVDDLDVLAAPNHFGNLQKGDVARATRVRRACDSSSA